MGLIQMRKVRTPWNLIYQLYNEPFKQLSPATLDLLIRTMLVHVSHFVTVFVARTEHIWYNEEILSYSDILFVVFGYTFLSALFHISVFLKEGNNDV
jgi:hypothetical protein